MKQAVSGIILLFVVFLLNVYLVVPKYTELLALKKEVRNEELLLQQREQYLSNLQKITEDLKDHQEALAKIEAALPEEFSLPDLLNFFQMRIAESGLVLKNINQTSQPQPKNGRKKTSTNLQEGYFNLVAKGTISSFENFLKVLENSARLVEVELISLKHGEGELPEFSLLAKVFSRSSGIEAKVEEEGAATEPSESLER